MPPAYYRKDGASSGLERALGLPPEPIDPRYAERVRQQDEEDKQTMLEWDEHIAELNERLAAEERASQGVLRKLGRIIRR